MIRWSPVIGASFFQVFKAAGEDPGDTEPAWWIASASETGIADNGYPVGTRGYDLNLGASPVFRLSEPCPPCEDRPHPCPEDPCAEKEPRDYGLSK